jgi:hypothetical protein
MRRCGCSARARGDAQHLDNSGMAIFPGGNCPAGFFAKFTADFEEPPWSRPRHSA